MPGEMVMFVKRLNESALAQSGEVMVQDITIPVPTNLYVSMCNPYPIEIAVASVTNYLNPKRGIGFSSADGIRRFDSATSSWKDYYLGANGWRKSGAGTGVTTDIIAPGEGFLFVKRTTASSINFTSPL